MPRFMLLIRGGDDPERTPEERRAAVQRYIDWSRKLHADGVHRGADELGAPGCTVRRRAGSKTVDGPFAETKEALGGYFIVEAPDLGAAAEIAKGCPALEGGGFVDIRPIIDHG